MSNKRTSNSSRPTRSSARGGTSGSGRGGTSGSGRGGTGGSETESESDNASESGSESESESESGSGSGNGSENERRKGRGTARGKKGRGTTRGKGKGRTTRGRATSGNGLNNKKWGAEYDIRNITDWKAQCETDRKKRGKFRTTKSHKKFLTHLNEMKILSKKLPKCPKNDDSHCNGLLSGFANKGKHDCKLYIYATDVTMNEMHIHIPNAYFNGIRENKFPECACC